MFAVEHTGAVLAQSALATHWTQAPVGAQIGIAVLFAAHAPIPTGAMAQGTHAPAAPQNGFVVVWQSLSAPHSTQAPVDAQTGRAALLAAHAAPPMGAMAQGTHAPAVPQNGFVTVWQSVSAPHSTQAPIDPQAGRAALFTAHAPVPAGAMAQGTHAPAVEQNGLVAVWQSVSAPHSTQAPLDPQTGLVVSCPAQTPAPAAAQETHAAAGEQKALVGS